MYYVYSLCQSEVSSSPLLNHSPSRIAHCNDFLLTLSPTITPSSSSTSSSSSLPLSHHHPKSKFSLSYDSFIHTDVDMVLDVLESERGSDMRRKIAQNDTLITSNLNTLFSQIILPVQDAQLLDHFDPQSTISTSIHGGVWKVFTSLMIPSWSPYLLTHPSHPLPSTTTTTTQSSLKSTKHQSVVVKIGIVTGNLDDNNGGMALLNLMKAFSSTEGVIPLLTYIQSHSPSNHNLQLKISQQDRIKVQFTLCIPKSLKAAIHTSPSTISKQIINKFHSLLELDDTSLSKSIQSVTQNTFDCLLFPDIFYSPTYDPIPFYLSLQRDLSPVQGCIWSEGRGSSVCHQSFILTPKQCDESQFTTTSSSSSSSQSSLYHLPIPTYQVVDSQKVGSLKIHDEIDVDFRDEIGGTVFEYDLLQVFWPIPINSLDPRIDLIISNLLSIHPSITLILIPSSQFGKLDYQRDTFSSPELVTLDRLANHLQDFQDRFQIDIEVKRHDIGNFVSKVSVILDHPYRPGSFFLGRFAELSKDIITFSSSSSTSDSHPSPPSSSKVHCNEIALWNHMKNKSSLVISHVQNTIPHFRNYFNISSP